jgi:histidinol-phosphate/aromatic aminotransferase/cobyric acid decarboxylase-like protein
MPTPVIECVEDAFSPEHLDDARANIARTVAERARLTGELAKLPFVRRVWPSGANFLFAELEDAPRVLEFTRRNSILIRHFAGPLADCVRITVGTPVENDCLLGCLRSLGS